MKAIQYLMLCSVLIIFAAGCAAAQVAERAEVQITTNASQQNDPAIYNDTIVWTDGRNVNITEDVENMSLQDIFDANIDIYMYNLSTGEEMQLSGNGSAQMAPAIYGDIVVWEDYSNASLPADGTDIDNITLDDWLQFDVNIHMYNMSSGESRMMVDNLSWQGDPAIYGELVVWHDLRNGNFDIYAYNLSSEEEIRITGNESDQIYPAVYDDRIVWEDSRNGNSDIYMYNLSRGEGMRITNNTSDQVSPAIYGDVIVWEDHTNVNLSDMDNITLEDFTQLDINIHMYNLSTGEETRITSNASAQINPAIHGDRIVWEDLRNGTGDIRMYDLSTGEEKLITEDSFWQEAPDIYEDRIVWTDYRNGNKDIYVFDLSSGESGPIVPPVAVRDDDFDDRDDDFDDRDDDFDDDNDDRDDGNDDLDDDNDDDDDDDNDDLDDDNDDQDDDNDD